MGNIKNSVKSGTVKSVKFVGAAIHLPLQIATNLVYVIGNDTCKRVAQGEGLIVEAIDGTPRKETFDKRYQNTKEKIDFMSTFLETQVIDPAVERLAWIKKDIAKSAAKIERKLTQPAEDVPNRNIEFQLAELRQKRQAALNNSELSDSERNKTVHMLNQHIGELNKIKNLPKATPAEAFDLNFKPAMG